MHQKNTLTLMIAIGTDLAACGVVLFVQVMSIYL